MYDSSSILIIYIKKYVGCHLLSIMKQPSPSAASIGRAVPPAHRSSTPTCAGPGIYPSRSESPQQHEGGEGVAAKGRPGASSPEI